MQNVREKYIEFLNTIEDDSTKRMLKLVTNEKYMELILLKSGNEKFLDLLTAIANNWIDDHVEENAKLHNGITKLMNENNWPIQDILTSVIISLKYTSHYELSESPSVKILEIYADFEPEKAKKVTKKANEIVTKPKTTNVVQEETVKIEEIAVEDKKPSEPFVKPKGMQY